MRGPSFLLLLLTALTLTGCPTPRTPGSIASPSSAPSKVFAVAGHSLSVNVIRPAATTAATGVTANVTLIDPNNLPVSDFTVTPASDSAPRVTVVFTPRLAGSWQLVVAFEPSLGRVQMPIEVADERLNTPRMPVSVSYDPHRCSSQPFKTHHGLVLCELTGRIHSQRPGADEVIFDGEQLMVLGDVVWWSHGAELIRATDTGAELRVDATVLTDGVAHTGRAFTSEVTAIRAYDLGRDAGRTPASLVRYDFADGGLTATKVSTSSSERLFISDGGLSHVWADPITRNSLFCPPRPTDAGCADLRGYAYALDSSGLWVDQMKTATSTVAVYQPPSLGAGGATLVLANGWLLARSPLDGTTGSSFERPLVDQEAVAVFKVGEPAPLIIRHLGGDFTLTSYGEGEVLGTRGDSLVLALPDAGARPRIVFVDY